MLEAIANAFYDPLVFWGTPLILALLAGAVRCRRRRHAPGRERRKGRFAAR